MYVCDVSMFICEEFYGRNFLNINTKKLSEIINNLSWNKLQN